MLTLRLPVLVFSFILLLSPSLRADNWPQWRGPNFNGATTESNLPSNLDTPLWSAPLPGLGAGTPIVFNDRVFVSAVETGSFKLLALCYDRATGKQLWQREVAVGFSRHPMNNYGSPSASTDGQQVFFFFGCGDLAAFDLDGKPLWSRNIQKDHGNFNTQFLYGSTPLLYKNKLFLPVLHRDKPYGQTQYAIHPDSYLLAIDPATGKDLWKHIRPNQAVGESKESYCTPLPYEANGRSEIVIVGADCLTGHDPDTGKELWRGGDWNSNPHNDNLRIVPSLVAAGDLFICCTPKVRGFVFATRAGGNGDITATHIAWRNKELTSDVPIPLYYQNNLYVLDGDFKKGLSCLDPQTGQRKWFTPLETRSILRTSPTGADGKIYIMNEAAEVWVLWAADGAILSKTALGDEGRSRASISAAQGQIFIRTATKLYSFKKK
jgi:outer membrane protein assembly factor BamB